MESGDGRRLRGVKSVRNLDVTLGDGTTITQPQNWRYTYAVMIGTEYKWLVLESLQNWEVALRAAIPTSKLKCLI